MFTKSVFCPRRYGLEAQKIMSGPYYVQRVKPYIKKKILGELSLLSAWKPSDYLCMVERWYLYKMGTQNLLRTHKGLFGEKSLIYDCSRSNQML